LTSGERASAAKGQIESIRSAWAAVLQFTIDKTTTVWQIDLALPGHTCTIAESDAAARTAFPVFQYDGRRVRLTGKGSHRCAMAVPGPPLEWNVEVDTPVVNRRDPL